MASEREGHSGTDSGAGRPKKIKKIVKINILSKFEEDWAKTVSCRVITSFS